MSVYNGGLYVGTNSWANLVKGYKGKGWVEDLLADASGYQLWATCEGENWFPVSRDAFGYGEYDFGARTLVTGHGPNGEELFIGSANQAQGTEIVDDHESLCSSLINSSRRVPAPNAMIAEAADRGKSTLLSWKASSKAVRYDVLAANETNLTLYLQPQPSTTHDAFQFEGAQPLLSTPETPGAVPVALSLPGEFESVGTTTNAYFVAHTHAHRVYEVVAENADGERSNPSNIQVVPTPEPPATFASVRGAIGSSGPGRHSAAHAASVSTAQRLLDAAQAAWSHGDRAGALADLQRLQSLEGGQRDELSALASRLERMLEYGAAAGEP